MVLDWHPFREIDFKVSKVIHKDYILSMLVSVTADNYEGYRGHPSGRSDL